MWSRKPTPVRRSPSPAPSSASVSSTFVSLVRRTISDRRLNIGGIVLDAGLHRLGVQRTPRHARSSPRPRELLGGRNPHLRGHPAEVRDTDSAEANRSGAARRQDVVGAGDVVPERRPGPRRRTRSRRGAPRGARISGLRAHELQVLGAISSKASASSRLASRTSTRVLDGGRHGGEIGGRRERRAVEVRARPGTHVERHQRRIGALGEDDGELAGAGERVVPTTPESCRLASCTHTFPGPAITSTRGTPSVPSAATALCAAHPVDLLHTAQRAGRQHRGIDVAVLARRGADRDLIHAGRLGGHGAHHDRAGVGRAPPGT